MSFVRVLFTDHAWTVLAVLMAAFGLAIFFNEGLLVPPTGESHTKAILFIWGVSLFVSVVGVFLAIADTSRLIRERKGAWRLSKYFASEKKDPSFELAHGRVETIAHRLYREAEAIRERGGWLDRGWSEWALRGARVGLAGIGSTTRAIAGLLMILAVLGTFAGMVAAVPQLAEAIQDFTRTAQGDPGPVASGESAEGSSEQLRLALNHISAAFGANLLALFGAVVLGMASLGAVKGRDGVFRTLASALEQEVHRSDARPASGSDLTAAVRAMTTTASAVVGTKDSIDSLREMLGGFRRDLRESLEDLGSSVSRSIQISLEEQMVRTLETTSEGVGRVAEALAATTVAYEALLEDQALNREALKEGVRGLERSAAAVGSNLQAGSDSFRAGVADLKGSVEDTGASLARATESLTQSGERLERASGQLELSAQAQASAVREWTEASQPLADQLDGALRALEVVGKEAQSATAEILAQIREANNSADDRSARLLERMQGELQGTTAAIKEAGELVAQAGEDASEEARSSLRDASIALAETCKNFVEAIESIRRARDQLLDKPPVRVELSDRSIDGIAEASRKGRGLLGWFRRGRGG